MCDNIYNTYTSGDCDNNAEQKLLERSNNTFGSTETNIAEDSIRKINITHTHIHTHPNTYTELRRDREPEREKERYMY